MAMNESQKIIHWWDSLPVNKRIELKDLYLPECEYLVNVKSHHIINSENLCQICPVGQTTKKIK